MPERKTFSRFIRFKLQDKYI